MLLSGLPRNGYPNPSLPIYKKREIQFVLPKQKSRKSQLKESRKKKKVTKENIRTIKYTSATNLISQLSLEISKACFSCRNKTNNSAPFPFFYSPSSNQGHVQNQKRRKLRLTQSQDSDNTLYFRLIHIVHIPQELKMSVKFLQRWYMKYIHICL